MSKLTQIIDQAFAERAKLTMATASKELKNAVDEVLSGLDSGILRVAEKIQNNWIVHQWLKKAVLLSFKLYPNQVIDAGFCQFFDKVPLKFTDYSAGDF